MITSRAREDKVVPFETQWSRQCGRLGIQGALFASTWNTLFFFWHIGAGRSRHALPVVVILVVPGDAAAAAVD